MSTFNFTVRATDNAGAFADRTFSINVNDTVNSSTYDRFLAATTTGITRSMDGVTWSAPDTTMSSFNRVTYGNGMWVAFNSTSGQYRYAPAATMAWSSTISISNGYTDNANYSNNGLLGIDMKYRGGRWIALVSYYSTANGFNGAIHTESTSTDITANSWTFRNRIATQGGIGAPNIGTSFDYDPATQTYYAIVYNVIYRRSGTGAWTYIAAANQYGGPQVGGGDVRFTNGLWLINPMTLDSSLGSFYSSTDGIGLVVRSGLTGSAGVGIYTIYQNGRILGLPINSSTGASLQVKESTNGGRTFTNRGPATTAYPQGYSQGSTLAAPHQIAATYGATTVWVGSTPVNTVFVTTNDFLTTTAQTIPGASSNVLCVTARDS